jgi:hypothetical protein
MLRPERMSRVSVTGSKGVMDEVIETVHDLRLFDMTDYDGEWEGFSPGDPVAGANEASEQLVTVRSLESILDIDPDEHEGPTRVLEEDELASELADVRERVNDLDDRRDELDDELRAVEERLDTVEPFVELGIDLDLLQGYDTLSVLVGQGDRDAVRRSLVEADGVDSYGIFGDEETGTVAVFVYPESAAVEDALVGANFTRIEIPETDAEPEEYVAELRDRKAALEDDLADVEAELDDLREEVGGFLLAAEEQLAIETQKREAPLSFATTENAFVAEGWLPTEQFVDLAERLQDDLGGHVAVEELERADYDEHGFATGPSDDATHGGAGGEPVAANGAEHGEKQDAATDAWNRDDRLNASVIVILLLLVGGQVALTTVNSAYRHPTADHNELVQYAQPVDDFRPGLQTLDGRSASDRGVDVVFYGEELLVENPPKRGIRPLCADISSTLPLQWYLTRANATATCAANETEFDRVVSDARPVVVIARAKHQGTLADDLDGYVARTYRLRTSNAEVVMFIDTRQSEQRSRTISSRESHRWEPRRSPLNWALDDWAAT